MKFRKATINDFESIMVIIKQAQDYFKGQGIDQWQNNYPNAETITNDINNNYSYVLELDNKILATSAVIFGEEPIYNQIYEGAWLSATEYCTIHRIAVDNNYKGLGLSSKLLENIETLCKDKNVFSIKVDTHEENLSMQKLLKKNSFEYCGIIYLDEELFSSNNNSHENNNKVFTIKKDKRVAFEKILSRAY